MKHLDYSIHAAEKDILSRLPGSKFVSYHSDMETPERAYSVVILRVGNMDIELRIKEIESPEEWIADTTTTTANGVRLEEVQSPAGKRDESGNYVPNKFISYPVESIVKGVSIINEITTFEKDNEESCVLTTTRGYIIETDKGFVAIDKTESFGEVWTIITGTTELYYPDCRESEDEAPEFTTRVEVVKIA